MTQTIQAVYEHGVFKPLHPLQLPEHLEVLLTVQTPGEEADADAALLQLLEEPVELGAKQPLNRRTIYDETG